MKIFSFLIFISFLFADGQPEKAAEWVLQSTDGERIALYDLKGKIVIIDFWAIWCATCKPELQELSKLQEQMRADGVVVVAIGVDSGDLNFLKEFQSYLNLNFPLLTGQKRQIKRILREYGNIRQIPSIIIIDKEGNIVHRITGFRPQEELIKLVNPLL